MRPDIDETFLAIAHVLAQRSTCRRRQVGCVLVDAYGHVLSTGYNGTPRGLPHCVDHPCVGADAQSGRLLEACEATHAEQNALLQCPDERRIVTCFVTTSPCVHCVKMLLNTSCTRIVFREPYAHDEESRKLWLRLQGFSRFARRWIRLSAPGQEMK